MNNLKLEVNSRWKLWETAISLEISPHLLEINSDVDNDLLYIVNSEYKSFKKGKIKLISSYLLIPAFNMNSYRLNLDVIAPFLSQGVFNINSAWLLFM